MKKRSLASFEVLYEEVERLLHEHESNESIFVRFRKVGCDKPLEIEAISEMNLCGKCTCEMCSFCIKFDWLHGQSVENFGQVKVNLSALKQKVTQVINTPGSEGLAFARFREYNGELAIELVSGRGLCTGCTCSTCSYCGKFDWLQGLPV